MSNLINIFLEPGKVFADLKERPTFLVPMLIVVATTALAILLYHLNVDPEWFSVQQTQAMAANDMSQAEIAQAQQFMPGARMSGYIGAIAAAIMFVVIYLVMALYYLLAGKVTGNAVSFRHGLALTAWSAMPMVLATVITIVGIYVNSPQTAFTSLQLLNVDPLVTELPLDHPWSTLAKSFSLLNFWVWFLAALGWKTWFRTGWGQALFVVMLPSVVIYGVMALFAAL